MKTKKEIEEESASVNRKIASIYKLIAAGQAFGSDERLLKKLEEKKTFLEWVLEI